MLRFEYESFLGFLLLLPIMYLVWNFYQKDKENKLSQFASKENLKRILHGAFRMKSKRWMASAIAILFLVLGIANLQKGSYALSSTKVKGGDILVVLDVSKSMLATDVSPSRMGLSKIFIKRLIEQSKKDRIGILSFSGSAELDMPLTSDHISLLNTLETREAGSAKVQGTAIADALSLGLEAFDDQGGKQQTVLLVTDGEDHESGLTKVLNEYKSKGIKIMAIGVGSPEGAKLSDPKSGRPIMDDGEVVVSKYDPKLLREIADKTGGYMGELDGIRSAKIEADNVLSSADRKLYDTSNFQERASFHWLFLLLAAISILLGFFPNGKNINRRALVSLLVILSFYSASAQNTTPSKSDIDAGLVGMELYRDGEFSKAREAFAQAVKQHTDKNEQAMFQYLVGNTYAHQKNWKQAIDAYKNSLRLNPNDEDARYNLRYAQEMDKKKKDQDQKQQNQQQKNQQKKQQEQQQKQQEQQKKENEENGNEPKDQKPKPNEGDKKEEQRKAPRPSGELSKEDAEAMLKALRDKEKKLHEGEPGDAQRSKQKDW